jgi:hypothetical protein
VPPYFPFEVVVGDVVVAEVGGVLAGGVLAGGVLVVVVPVSVVVVSSSAQPTTDTSIRGTSKRQEHAIKISFFIIPPIRLFICVITAPPLPDHVPFFF